MTSSTISALTAGSALAGTEPFETVQGGVSVKVTANQIKTFANVPGGSSGQLQYNNSSAFGGMSGTSWDDTNRSLTLTGATVTTSKPIFDISQTWNAGAISFTGFKMSITETSAASGSLLMDLVRGGVPQFRVTRDGKLVIGEGVLQLVRGGLTPSGTNYTLYDDGSHTYVANANSSGFVKLGTNNSFSAMAGYGSNRRFFLGLDTKLLWSSNTNLDNGPGTPDLGMARNAAGVVEINNGTAGTLADATLRYLKPQVLTVGTLASAATAGAGACSHVSDASGASYTFGATVSAGGSRSCPVFSDGSNWKEG